MSNESRNARRRAEAEQAHRDNLHALAWGLPLGLLVSAILIGMFEWLLP